ncbi:alpha/beta hydrolase domain-containing protein [Caballeronia udeis]|uniref:Alpha/beta hydrolase domain-containing protein n=2 Tax=Caballeronia udeis TaxID=1232866 RepID=A0A158JE03_9BURK|nr:alpha/beta hydrolase domain-containing protein [Caballeronia udeis]
MPQSFDLSPQRFELAAVDDEIRALADKIAKKFSDAPARWELSLDIERSRGPGSGLLELGTNDLPLNAENFSIDGPGGPILIRKFIPSNSASPAGVYLHLHGGGFCTGSARGQDAMLNRLAHDAQVIVLSVDYRLAPEHPYPAAVADAEAAAFWLVRSCAGEFGVERIVIGGESAGAYLSVSAALRLRDRHSYAGLAGLNLFQGTYDLRGTPSVMLSDNGFVGRRSFRTLMERFVPEGLRNDPEVSPLCYSLHDLPPALFSAGTTDPVLDDSLFMHARWLSYTNAAELAVYPGAFHGFSLFDCELAHIANQKVASFVHNACTSA